MKAEDVLDDNFESEYYAGETFGDFAYPRNIVIQAMNKYGEEVLKIAAKKAEVNVIGYNDYEIDIDSILNCLK